MEITIEIREFYNLAKEVARGSLCHKTKFGAVLISENNMFLSAGHNVPICGDCNDHGGCLRVGVKSGENAERCHAIHAEQNAIITALSNETIKAPELVGATIVLYGEYPDGEVWDMRGLFPCTLCSRLMAFAGIGGVVAKSWGELVFMPIQQVLETSYLVHQNIGRELRGLGF